MSTTEVPTSIQDAAASMTRLEPTQLGILDVSELEQFNLALLYPDIDHAYGAARFDAFINLYRTVEMPESRLSRMGHVLLSKSTTPGINQEHAIVRSLLRPEPNRHGIYKAINTVTDGDVIYGHSHNFVTNPQRTVRTSSPEVLTHAEAMSYTLLGRPAASSVVKTRCIR